MINVSLPKFKYVRKLLGFTKSGSSVLGKQARKVATVKRVKRVSGASLIGLLSAVAIIRSVGTIGGQLAFDPNAASGNFPTVDAITIESIQVPLVYDYESRGVSAFHTGVDLVASTGTPIKPIMKGKVRATNYDLFGYGNHVIVLHDEGYESLYAHLSKVEVTPGDEITNETKIGEVGSTGLSTGPHLHLEVRQNGQLLNPADLVPGVK